MTFLPIVARELRVASRRRLTYWVRSGAALIVVLVGTWLFLMLRNERPQEAALVLFGVLSGVAVLYCLLSGVRGAADCLSQEKREGTLGLLFLTDLKGYDVVLGKLAANSLNAFYGVLAVVPVLAVPLLMGGVSVGEFGRMALVAINALFFSLAIGICVSALTRSARSAVGATFLVIVLFAALCPATGALVVHMTKSTRLAFCFMLPSPGFAFYMGFDMPYKAVGHLFWWSIVVILALALLFLAAATLIVPHTWQDKPAGIRRLRWRERWKLWSYGDSAERLTFRRRLLDRNPFFWLAARARFKPALVWGLLGLLGCGWTWGLLKFKGDWLSVPLYTVTGMILNLLMKGWFASENGRQLTEDRKHGALELLLSTPLTVREILRGQRLALQRQFLAPMIAVLLVGVVLMVATGRETALDEEHTLYLVTWLGSMVMFGLDLVALYWVGLWQAMTVKNPNRAASAAIVRIMVLPWLAFAVGTLVASLLTMRTHRDPSEKLFLTLWFGLGLAADLGFGLWARHQVHGQFRRAAAQQYARPTGFWRRFLS